MVRFSYTQTLVILEVANRHKGEDTTQQYLRKLARTCKDMLDGKSVRKWRLLRLQKFAEDVGITCLQKSRQYQGGWF